MTTTVPYEKQTLDNPNPIARFAHRTRFKKSAALVLDGLKPGATVFDYGCGQGRFLHELTRSLASQPAHADTKFLGYDPYMAAQFEGYTIFSDLESVQNESLDVITSLEVCEHLDDEATARFVRFIEEKLKPDGKALVTVPIMIGPAVLVKELSRMLLFRRRSDTASSELWRAAFLSVPPQRAEDIAVSHRGYDWRVTHRILSEKFRCEKLMFSPLPLVGGYGNSQAIMVCRKRGTRPLATPAAA